MKTSVEKLRPHGPTVLLAESLLTLARSLRSYGGLEDRLQLILEAITILQQLDARRWLSRAYTDLGAILKEGVIEGETLYDALRAFELATDLAAESEDEGLLSTCHYQVATICRRLGLHLEAIALLQKADECIPKVDLSLDRWRRQIASERLFNNLALGRREDATRDVEEWIRSLRDGDASGDGHWMPFFHRGELREDAGDVDGALDDYCTAAVGASKQILENVSDRFRQTDRSRLNFVFETSVRVALRSHRPELAFGLFELAMTGGLALHPGVEPAEGVAGSARARLREELAILVDEAQELVVDRGSRDRLLRCQQRADWLLTQNAILSVPGKVDAITRERLEGLATRVRAKLPAGTILLEYACVSTATRGHVLESGDIWVFCLSRDSLEVRKTNLTCESVAMLSEAFAQECQGIFPTDALDVLGRELLDSVGESLADSKSLLIVPSVGLHGVPFHAMQFRGNRLVESHAVSYLPRASTLLEPGRTVPRVSGDSSWKGLGAPRVEYADLSDLPAVPEELAAIASHFASAECVLDPPATSRDLLECDAPPDVLHIACHGDFDVDAPLLARLMLSDRPVFAFEIMLTKLNVNIVVLSACQTGEARAGLGGHVQSLASAFLSAGAATVVASLWPVADRDGAECLERFYKAMIAQQDASISKSLAIAQRSMQSEGDRPHLFFWAPFAVFSANIRG
jgi:tetratricopeptide (TPR) repeat protein